MDHPHQQLHWHSMQEPRSHQYTVKCRPLPLQNKTIYHLMKKEIKNLNQR